jgi:cysteine desulfuration protein SufE
VTYPPKLNNIINLFESLPEDERRETLVSYADNAKKQEPRDGEQFDLQDIRKDEECATRLAFICMSMNRARLIFG